MKYAIILATVHGSVLQKAGLEEGSKRYSQLMSMMQNFNPDFDEKKYWAYGCNCLILGDRPMSDPGHGAPVDALDTVCKKYKGKVQNQFQPKLPFNFYINFNFDLT